MDVRGAGMKHSNSRWNASAADSGLRSNAPRSQAEMPNYAIKVIQKNGDEEYLRAWALGEITRFPSYAAAMKQHDFLKIGMEGEVQSINVVKYPAKKKVS
jgi:hypothetical protein